MRSHPFENDVLCLCRERLLEESERQRFRLAANEVASNRQAAFVQLRELSLQARRDTELVASWVLVSPLELVGGRIIWQAPQLPPLGIIRLGGGSSLASLEYRKSFTKTAVQAHGVCLREKEVIAAVETHKNTAIKIGQQPRELQAKKPAYNHSSKSVSSPRYV